MRTSTGSSPRLYVAAHQGYVRLAALDFAFVGNQAKLSVLCVNQSLAHAVHIALVLHAIANQLRYRQQLQAVDLAEFDQIGHARHGPVVAHDFADNAGGHQSRHSGQVYRRFSLSGAHQHSAFARPQREDVAGSGQVRRPGCGIDGNFDSAGAIVG